MSIRSLAVRLAGIAVVCAIARATVVILSRPALNGTLPGSWEGIVLALSGLWAAWTAMLWANERADRIRDDERVKKRLSGFECVI